MIAYVEMKRKVMEKAGAIGENLFYYKLSNYIFSFLNTLCQGQFNFGSFLELLMIVIFQIIEPSFLMFESDNTQTSFALFSSTYLSFLRLNH